VDGKPDNDGKRRGRESRTRAFGPPRNHDAAASDMPRAARGRHMIAECPIVASCIVEKRRHKVAELPNHIACREPSITHQNRNEIVLLNKKNS